ncbi:glycosyltransferase [Paenarthrobacter sp. Z7-10]|uniref:glycosyltransferase n=1 Tax=Paenarthrobacter sp. Z7-10 TaxID=2787635 RepID=UPI0022A9686C|nr:glycosyltransferase [Paenarthrobacter sp. Z7-10]MCZ2403447.1 glycosyltransferase [Paenarthrobacter sp. Z7-10]
MTTAMLNRARVFRDRGLRASIVTFDYNPNYAREIAVLKSQNRMSDDTDLLNIFNYYSSLNTARLPARRTSNPAPRQVDHLDKRQGVVLREEYSELGIKVREQVRDTSSNLIREERYFTPDGFCYLTVLVNPDTSVPTAIFVHFIDGRPTEHYPNNRKWRTAWIDRMAQEEHVTPIVICDGPGSAPTVMGMATGLARRIYQIHINHFEAPFSYGSPIKPNHNAIFSKLDILDRVVVLTAEQRMDVVRDYGRPERLTVIPNFCSIGKASTIEKIPGRVSMLVRFHPQKRVEDAIRAFSLVLESSPAATLYIYGRGSEKANYHSLIRHLGLEGGVVIEDYTDDARKVLASSVCTVLTSTYEAFSLSIAESLSAGTPAVAFDCPYGPASLLEDGRNGYIIRDRDIDALGRAILQLVNNPGLAAQLGDEGRRIMVERYSDEIIFQQWSELFDELDQIAGSPTGG